MPIPSTCEIFIKINNYHLYTLISFIFILLFPHYSVASTTSPPNIIIIYADDLGYGEVSYQNKHALVKTPHIDALAQSGIQFTDGHSGGTTCTPSRYSLLTGQYSFRVSIPGGVCRGFAEPIMRPETVTLPEFLQDNGYHTGMVGKWHLGIHYELLPDANREEVIKKGQFALGGSIDWSKPCSGGPVDNGFDYYFGEDCINYGPFTYIENQRVTHAPSTKLVSKKGGPKWISNEFIQDQVLNKDTEKAVQFIKNHSGKKNPFFLYFAQPSPHAPHAPSKDFLKKSKHGKYYDYVLQTDWSVGQITKAVDEAEIRNNTLIIFSSDNGTEFHGYKYNQQHPNYHVSGPFRGLKRDLWEGGHRVPFITSWPSRIKEGQISNETVCVIDFFASFASLLQAKIPSGQAVDSMNILPALLGSGPADRSHTVPYLHIFNKSKVAIRKGDWVFINQKSGSINKNRKNIITEYSKRNNYQQHDSPYELYNLKHDPSQHHNVFKDHPEKADEMLSSLELMLNSKHTVIR